IEGTESIGAERVFGVRDATHHGRLSREVVNDARAVDGGVHRVNIPNIAMNQLEPRVGRVLCNVREQSAGEVIEYNHLCPRGCEETIDEVATDETGPASHNDTFGPERHGQQYSALARVPALSQS